MDYNTITQVDYTDHPITDGLPVKTTVITEPRTNIQNCLTFLDTHQGSQRLDTHGIVTTSTNGFAPSSIFALLDSLIEQLNELEDITARDPFPPGVIAIWDGELEDIPENWVVCQGAQGTPDMRGRIPVGVSSSRKYKSTGGSMTIDVNLANILKSHRHSFPNALHPFSYDGVYQRYTKFGTINCDSSCQDWDNYPCVLKETMTAAGTTASTGTKSAKFTPAHIAKWYIMRLENPPVAVPYYTISKATVANATIKTNYIGTVRGGTRLVITVVPKEGYVVNKVFVNNEPVANNSTRYVNDDINISAEIAKIG